MCATSSCLYPISSFATRLASASVAMYVSYEGLASNATVCIVLSIILGISRKLHLSSRNPLFTISLAAFTMQGMLPPWRIDS